MCNDKNQAIAIQRRTTVTHHFGVNLKVLTKHWLGIYIMYHGTSKVSKKASKLCISLILLFKYLMVLISFVCCEIIGPCISEQLKYCSMN